MEVVGSVGLDVSAAQTMLDSDAYSQQVRAEQKISLENGISSVPTFIVNNKYAITGGQTADAFKQALTQIVQGK